MVKQTVPGLQRLGDDNLKRETIESVLYVCADNAELAMKRIGFY